MRLLQVLVVDDEPSVHGTISQALSERARVRCAATTETALQQWERELRDGDFDLVFLNLWMPGVPDSIDFYRELQGLGPQMPTVVFMTSDSTAAGVVRELLRTVCIDKPFDRETLLDAVDEALEHPPESNRFNGDYRNPSTIFGKG
jgi:DNA-binding NtrC family response regulator